MVGSGSQEITFGDFRVLPGRRLLLAGDKPVRLGSRAFDLLLALVERPGELLAKDELVARVWPDTFVDETNLRVHIAALRKVLGEDSAGARYLSNEPGRGYRFVGAVTSSAETTGMPDELPDASSGPTLPSPLVRVVGRDEVVALLMGRLPRWRFASIVGPAGIGKTTVALVVAEHLAQSYRHGVCYVDLSLLSDDALALGAVATALGLPVHSQSPLPEIVNHLSSRRMLLVLDGCEGVLDASASLCDALLKAAPAVDVVATTREPLRAEGEHVVRLRPLGLPSGNSVAADDALGHAAIELFVERAAAALDGFVLTDADAPVVVEICRRLDGLPLAIELAAGRIEAFGVRGVAELLSDRFRLLSSGRRRALPRHQTLSAALDWSYELLTVSQAAMFRSLGIFAGGFSLDAAIAVSAPQDNGHPESMNDFASLVAKSLLSADVGGDATVYRMLDSTRSYALRKLEEHGETADIARRHAEFYLAQLERIEGDWRAPPRAGQAEEFRFLLDNIRAALDWATLPGGDAGLAAALTAASVMVWMQLSLVDECRMRVETALAIKPEGDDADSRRRDMHLYAALGHSLMFTKGNVAETTAALGNSFDLAQGVGDTEYSLRALWGMWVGRLNNGAIPAALELARRFGVIAQSSPDPLDAAIADRMIGFSLHFLGQNAEASAHMQRMLAHRPGEAVGKHIHRFQFDQWATARATLAESLWIQGFADQAVAAAEQSVIDAQATGHAVTICNTLSKASAVALHAGRLDLAATMIGQLRQTAGANALLFWRAEGGCLDGVCQIRSGDLAGGLTLLRHELRGFPGNTLTVRYIAYLGELADALSRAGEAEAAHAAIEEALERSQRNSERWCVAELLRIKGEMLLRSDATASEAEGLFAAARDWAEQQGALAWQLRTAMSLARLRQGQGRSAEAAALLRPVRERFSEGFGSADLIAAGRLLDDLAASPV